VTRQTKRQTGTSFRRRQPRPQLQIASDPRHILQASPPQLSVSTAANLAHRSSRKSRRSKKKSRETQVMSSHALSFSECIACHGTARSHLLSALAPHGLLHHLGSCASQAIAVQSHLHSKFQLRCHSSWKLYSTGNCYARGNCTPSGGSFHLQLGCFIECCNGSLSTLPIARAIALQGGPPIAVQLQYCFIVRAMH
jgi:hypothetical protein